MQNNDFELPPYHRRAFAHNYHAPFIYHIILKKHAACGAFGFVKGNAGIAPGIPGCAYIEDTALGRVIAKNVVIIQRQYPVLQIYQYKVMPDHVHILLRVKAWTEMHLDSYIDSLKDNIAESHSKATGIAISKDEIFQPGYCDKPLLLGRNLDTLFRYIRENPHRLAMRMQFPQFFSTVRNLRIGGRDYEAYGNLFLYRNPDKEAVKISRKFTVDEVCQKKAKWLSDASRGTILVSPFISPAEKGILSEALDLDAKIILITHEDFGERFKPAKHNFDLCSQGRLLIISLGMPSKTTLTYSICNQMNKLATAIANIYP